MTSQPLQPGDHVMWSDTAGRHSSGELLHISKNGKTAYVRLFSYMNRHRLLDYVTVPVDKLQQQAST